MPGLNPAIRAVTIRALREGYEVIGIRRGWAGLVDIVREKAMTTAITTRPDRRDRQSRRSHRRHVPAQFADQSQQGEEGPAFRHHLQETYNAEMNDLTPEVLKNLDWLGIDYLIPIGGDDTLSYGVRLYQEGVKVVAIPKTMDNDVPGTDYCIGFSTCVTRTIEMANSLRTSARIA